MSPDLTQTKTSGPPDPQSGTIKLDPSQLCDLVNDFTTAQNQLWKTMSGLLTALRYQHGAFLGDQSAYAFRFHYGQGLCSLLRGIVRIHDLFGKIGDALYASAQNHQKAGSGSNLPPPARADPLTISAPDCDNGLPNIADGDTHGIADVNDDAADFLQNHNDLIKLYFPWVHLEIRDPIVDAYNGAAQQLEKTLTDLYGSVKKTTDGNVSDDLTQFMTYFNPVARSTLVSDLPNLARDLGAAVKGYGHYVYANYTPVLTTAADADDYDDDDDEFKRDVEELKRLSGQWVNDVNSAPWIIELDAIRVEVDRIINSLKDPGAAASDTTQPNDPKGNPGANPNSPASPGGVPSGPGYRPAGSKAGDSGTKSGDDPGKKPGSDTGNSNPSGILDDGQAKRAKEQLDKLSPEDQQRFQQLLHDAKSPQEQAYLMKDLAAGHSVDEIASFDKLIHNHGDDPAWLQEHLTPTTNGDPQHPDFTYQGASWTQGQYPAAVAASTVLARAAVDPSYALKLTTGNQPDDQSSTSKDAFLERLHQEEQNVHDQGSTGGDGTSNPSQAATNYPNNTPGPGDNQGQQTSSSNGGTSDRQNYDGQNNQYGQGSTGGDSTSDPSQAATNYPDNTPGPSDNQGQQTDSSNGGGTSDGQNYGQNNQYQDGGSSAADHRDVLASVHRALDEGKTVPIQAPGADPSQHMVIVGYRGNQLEIYKPSGEITWISENDLVNGTMNPVGGGAPRNRMTPA